MGLKERFSPAEWADLCSAPFFAAMYVATAEGGRLEYTREIVAFTDAIGPSMAGAGELAQAIATEYGKRFGNRIGTGDLAVAYDDRAGMLAAVMRAGEALEQAGGVEAAPFASWILGLARRVASASGHGGFLGLGGQPISAVEDLALREIKTALRAGTPW